MAWARKEEGETQVAVAEPLGVARESVGDWTKPILGAGTKHKANPSLGGRFLDRWVLTPPIVRTPPRRLIVGGLRYRL